MDDIGGSKLFYHYVLGKTGYTKINFQPDGPKFSSRRTPHADESTCCKDITTTGIELESGAYVYQETSAKQNVLYTAKGGEIIQRVPAIVRVYDIVSRRVKCVIRIQNERILTCHNDLLVTVSLSHMFTNLYDMVNGDHIYTVEVKALVAMFCPTDEHLLVVPSNERSVLKVDFFHLNILNQLVFMFGLFHTFH